jgi:hypothetical protein
MFFCHATEENPRNQCRTDLIIPSLRDYTCYLTHDFKRLETTSSIFIGNQWLRAKRLKVWGRCWIWKAPLIMTMIMQPPGVGKARLTWRSVECLSWILGLLGFWVSFFLGLVWLLPYILPVYLEAPYAFFFFFYKICYLSKKKTSSIFKQIFFFLINKRIFKQKVLQHSSCTAKKYLFLLKKTQDKILRNNHIKTRRKFTRQKRMYFMLPQTSTIEREISAIPLGNLKKDNPVWL